MLRSQIISIMALLSGIGVLQSANIAQAMGLTIDAFDSPGAINIFTSPGSDRVTNAPGSGFLGASDRRILTDNAFAASTQSALPGFDIISGAAGGSGQRYLLTYDGATDSTSQTDIAGTFGSLGGVDVTSSDPLVNTLRFNFSTDIAINPGSAQIDIRAISGSGDAIVRSAFAPSAGTSSYDVSFSDFSGVDFTSLDALVVQFDNLAGSVFVLDSIETVGVISGPSGSGGGPGFPGPPPVPEPTTVLGSLLMLGLGTTLKSRFRKQAADT